ncbi:MAG: HEAT repeat domain-containing protein [Cyanobacteria bacterium P01_A01_bin.3]
MPPVTVEELNQLASSEDWGDRIKAINQARELAGDDALPLLSTLATDTNTRVRYAAVSQIGTLDLSDRGIPLPLLKERLETDPEVDVRAAAAAALGDLKQPGTLQDLLAALEREEEWLMVLSIIAALGELGDLGAMDAVLAAATDENVLIRATAASALGDLGDERGLEALQLLAADSDWQTRHRVCISLGKIAGDSARTLLNSLARDGEEQVAATAKDILEQTV